MVEENQKIWSRLILGHLLINVPSFLLCFMPMYFLVGICNTLWQQLLAILFSFAVGLSLSFLLWMFMITKWRIWAFSNLEPESMLKLSNLAERSYLLWPRGNRFERFEIRTVDERQRITELNKKIEAEESLDELLMMASYPEFKVYYLRKAAIVYELLARFIVLVISFILVLQEQYFLGAVLGVIIVFYGSIYKRIPDILSEESSIKLSVEGIELKGVSSFNRPWEAFRKVSVDRSNRILILHIFEGKEVSVQVFPLSIYKIKNINTFCSLIKVYSQRAKINKDLQKDSDNKSSL